MSHLGDAALWRGAVNPGPPADGQQGELSMVDLLRVLRRRWLLVVFFTVVCGGIAAYSALSAPTVYRAQAVIRLQDQYKTLTGMSDPSQPTFSNRLDALLSLLEVMRSEMVLGEAVDRSALRLRDVRTEALPGYLAEVELDPSTPTGPVRLEFLEEELAVVFGDDTVTAVYGDPIDVQGLRFTVPEPPKLTTTELTVLERDGVLRNVRSGLSTRQRPATDVVDVFYTARDPLFAQAVVNEVVEAFERSGLRMSKQQLNRRRSFLEEQLRQARAAQAEAQLALSQFRSREQVYSSQARLSAEQHSLQSIDVRREELLTERRFYSSILSDLERAGPGSDQGIGTLVSYPGITSNPVISSLVQQLIRHQGTRDELVTGETGVRSDHPDVRRVEELITTVERRLLDAVRSQLAVIESQVEALDRQQARGAQQMRRLPGTEAEEVRLAQRADAAGRLTVSLEAELQNARIAEAVEAGQVEILELARIPSPVGGSRTMLTILTGLAVGLFLGTGSAFAADRLNTSVKHQGDLERVSRIPGLAVIPRLSATPPGWRDRLPLGRWIAPPSTSRPGELVWGGRTGVRNGSSGPPPSNPSAEAYRALRTSLTFSHGGGALKTLVVTSATPREGKTTTAANLGLAYAQQGANVLIVDADLRRARQHQLFQVSGTPGLTEVLLGTAAPADAIRLTGSPGVSLLPAGTLTANPADLLGGMRMRQLLAACVARYDLIIVDSPPILAVTDAAILSVQADGTIVVVHAGRTDREAVNAAVQQLTAVGARVIGAVLNDPDGKVPQYSPYGAYGYYYEPVG